MLPASAQKNKVNPEDRQVDMDSPTFVPMVRVGKILEGNDSIKYVEMNNVYVFYAVIALKYLPYPNHRNKSREDT